MRPEVRPNRFEISNRFEKWFRLHGNFTTTVKTFLLLKHHLLSINLHEFT